MSKHFFGRCYVAGIEGAEFRVSRARFVEAHLIDDVFEKLWIAGPQRYAPLPVFVTDANGDQLRNFPGESHAASRVLGHHFISC